ncbi:MAG: type II toxin-antitoxin system RelE/ParE family toxin [Methanomicrobiales archaeon]|nr:type II toxin-antitoxin system RelE/ParE family toxin [Methanomicrobiales archaeon]
MVTVAYSTRFERCVRKIRDTSQKERVKAQIIRIVQDPEIGKPMRWGRKNSREVYVPPYRLSYCYDKKNDTLIFLAFYHKDEQ